MMTNDEYAKTQLELMTFAAVAAGMDIRGFLERIEHAETVGIFMMAPIQYTAASKDLQKIRNLAELLKPFADKAKEHRETVSRTLRP